MLKSNIDRLSLDGVAHFRPDWNDACECRGELVQKGPLFIKKSTNTSNTWKLLFIARAEVRIFALQGCNRENVQIVASCKCAEAINFQEC